MLFFMTHLLLAFALPAVDVFSGPTITVNFEGGKKVVIATNIVESPKCVAHVSKLIKGKFFDGQRFHRIEDWVVQWGDPLTKKTMNGMDIGEGGSGTESPFEESKQKYVRGMVGMASMGYKEACDSQIFILKKDALRLNGNYVVLGKVTKGMDVVDKLKHGAKIISMTISKSIAVKTTKRKG